jgi:xylulokinase
MSYIGLDVGTSSCKASVIDERIMRASARRTYPLLREKPGWAELDPSRVWQAILEVLAEIAPSARDAVAMSVSSLGESFVLLDERDRPLAGSMTYLDERGEEELQAISRAVEPRLLHAMTGAQLSAMYSLPKLLWLRRNRPEALLQAKKLLLYVDYAGYLLTGERAIDPSLASRTMLMDARALDWSDALLDAFRFPRDLLSPVRRAGSPLGTILKELARALKLPENLILYTGCHDQCAAALGAGVFAEGGLMAGEGSSESLLILAGRNGIDSSMDYLVDHSIGFEPFLTPDLYAVILGQPAYGTCFHWFSEQFANGKPPTELDDCCAEDAGQAFFLPYLAPNPMQPNCAARGAFLGITSGTTRAQMYRALHEGLCLETQVNCDLMPGLGVTPSRLVATGGCSRSGLHMQIKADVMGLRIDTVDTGDAGIAGLAMLSAVASGAFPDYSECAKAMVRRGATFLPKRDYNEMLSRYRRMRSAVQALYTGHPTQALDTCDQLLS